MMGKPTHCRKRTELLYNMIKNRTYVQLKDPASDWKIWNQESRKRLL